MKRKLYNFKQRKYGMSTGKKIALGIGIFVVVAIIVAIIIGVATMDSGARCPKNCSGRGTCVNNTCQCDAGWASEDCSKQTKIIPATPAGCMATKESCQNQGCDSTFCSGGIEGIEDGPVTGKFCGGWNPKSNGRDMTEQECREQSRGCCEWIPAVPERIEVID